MLLFALLVAGCSGSSGPSDHSANPCATPGATYVEVFTQTSGNCGPIPNQVINVSPGGDVTASSTISCASSNQNGCTATGSDCTFTSQGFDFTETYSTTFASDGSAAMGVLSLSGNGMGMSATACTPSR
jgi:hypothetical protein